MKKIILLFILINTLLTYGQDKFISTPKGITDFVIVNIDSLNADRIYSKTIAWINENYKNPNEVITNNIKNDKIRISGFKENMWQYKFYNYNCKYIIEISIKDGKYKFDPISISNGSNSTIGFYEIDLNNFNDLYNKNGEITSAYKNFIPALENLLNSLNSSLAKYLNSNPNNKW